MAHAKERILPYLLVLLWLAIVLVELTVPVQSQGCLPPFVTPGYMDPITITNSSWKPAIGNVTVRSKALLQYLPLTRRAESKMVKGSGTIH
jgi:cellobiose-specific phosphotransferase system component IIC